MKLKVGDKVRILRANIDTDLVGKVEVVTRVEGGRFWTEHSVSCWRANEVGYELVKSSNSKGGIMSTVRDLLKSKKQKLYEEYVLDEDGNLDLSSEVLQKFLFNVLEKNDLEHYLEDHDKKVKEEEKKNKK